MSEPRRPVVLLVDDEPRILSALRRALRREGYELLSAETTQEALKLFDSSAVDCVLSDHMMPGMTGLQLLAHVALERPETVRVLITGWNEDLPPAELERLGIRTVLNKPWDDAELKATLRAALGPVDSGESGH